MSSSTDPVVSYNVRVRPEPHEIEVEVMLDALISARSVRLEFPTWVPGDYFFMPFGRDLFEIKAVDAQTGASLQVTRTGWQAFEVQGSTNGIHLSYKVYAYETDFSEPCGLVDSEYAVLLGGRYLHIPNWSGACQVTYELPADWKLHHPAGASQVGSTLTWEYPNYEILLDSPVVVGGFECFQRQVKGTDFFFVFVDKGLGYDSQMQPFVTQLTAVAEEFYELFGSFPFENYTFILSLNPVADWGLEHLTSSMCGLGPDHFIDPDQTGHGVRVCAHELFHAWNVRRLRPAPLKQLDFYNGSFTEGLWVAEGFTRYYEFLTCTRTRVYTVEQFFSAVINYYRHLSAVPAYKRVTAVDSSLASFLNHNKYSGRCNNSIDYYDKGMVIAFILDAELRRKSSPDSLDQAISAFYKSYVKSEKGYTTQQVINFFGERLVSLGELLEQAVTDVTDLPLESQLQELGFEVNMESIYYLGLMFNDTVGPAIYNVLDNSPAGRSGIAPEDIITAVNGYPFSFKALLWAANREETVILNVLRGHRTLTFKITPATRTQIGSLFWSGSNEQTEQIRRWLHCPEFQPTAGQKFSLDFYENFHGIETIV